MGLIKISMVSEFGYLYILLVFHKYIFVNLCIFTSCFVRFMLFYGPTENDNNSSLLEIELTILLYYQTVLCMVFPDTLTNTLLTMKCCDVTLIMSERHSSAVLELFSISNVCSLNFLWSQGPRFKYRLDY